MFCHDLGVGSTTSNASPPSVYPASSPLATKCKQLDCGVAGVRATHTVACIGIPIWSEAVAAVSGGLVTMGAYEPTRLDRGHIEAVAVTTQGIARDTRDQRPQAVLQLPRHVVAADGAGGVTELLQAQYAAPQRLDQAHAYLRQSGCLYLKEASI